MTENSVLDFYRDVLKSSGLFVDDDGKVYLTDGNGKTPITIGKKHLVLPTEENINTLVKDKSGRLIPKYSFFHPLKESDLQPESATLKKLKDCFSGKLSLVAYITGMTILSLMVEDPKNPLVTEIYPKVIRDRRHTPDKKTIETFNDIVSKYMESNVSKSFVSFYIKRGGKIGDTAYRRIVSIWYPIYEDLLKAEETRVIKGIKLRKKDIHILLGLYRLMFPFVDDESKNIIGSQSKIAPSFEALLKAVERASQGLVELIRVFKIDLSDVGGDLNFDYIEFLDDIENKKADIERILVHEDKQPPKSEEKMDSAPAIPAPQTEHRGLDPREILRQVGGGQPSLQQQVPLQHPPSVKKTDRGIDPRSLTGYGIPPQPPIGYQQPMHPQYQQPAIQQQYQQPIQQYHQPMQQQFVNDDSLDL